MNKPCPTCPFLEINRDKPNPTGFKCEDVNETEWYSQENIDMVWQKMRTLPIVFLSCHTTDPDYFGKDNKPMYACVSATFAVYMHMAIFDYFGSYKAYKNAVGADLALSLPAMSHKADAMADGETHPDWGSMLLTKTFDLDNVMRWPTGFEKTVQIFTEIYKQQPERYGKSADHR